MTGEELKRFLKKEGVTLKTLAEKMGITPQTLNSRLKAKSVSVDTISEIEKVTGKSIYLENMGDRSIVNTGAVKGSIITGDGNVIEDKDQQIILLKERVVHLEEMLKEKERFIQTLLSNK